MDTKLYRRTVLQAGGSVTLLNLAFAGSADSGTVVRAGTPDRHGPMRTGRFVVEIDGVEVPGWRSVTIPSSTTSKEQSLWGQTTFDDLEMERGVRPGDSTIFDWREAIRMGKVDEGRKDVVVTLLDEVGLPQIRWTFRGAWVRRYDPPELDATADGDVATESVELPFDSMVVDWEPEADRGELRPVGPFDAAPRDLDEDGLYEDVNGDGVATVVDVQALHQHLDDDVVTEHAEKFNFSGTDPGEVTRADVEALFDMVTGDGGDV